MEEVESLEANQGNCVLAGFPPGFSQSGGFTLLTLLDLSNASSDARFFVVFLLLHRAVSESLSINGDDGTRRDWYFTLRGLEMSLTTWSPADDPI